MYFNIRTIHPAFRTPVISGQNYGEDVTVYAHQGAGGYGIMFGIILAFSLTFPGAVLSSSFLPGYRVPLIGVSLVLLLAVVSPLFLLVANYTDPYFYGNCTEAIESVVNCSQYDFDFGNANNTFVQCVGLELTSPEIYCLQTQASILPQIGLFHTLSLSLMSSVVFYSEPADFATEVFVPNLVAAGASCSGTSCSFAFARELYQQSIGFMCLGAVLLLILGVAISYVALYPAPILIRLR